MSHHITAKQNQTKQNEKTCTHTFPATAPTSIRLSSSTLQTELKSYVTPNPEASLSLQALNTLFASN